MFSGSLAAGFVLALPSHHGDLEPDCVGVLMRGEGLMHGVKVPLQNFALKMQGGLVFAGHYGTLCCACTYLYKTVM